MSYCLIPDDCRQFWSFVDKLALDDRYKTILRKSTVTKVRVDVEHRSWEICLRLLRPIPAAVLQDVSAALAAAYNLAEVSFIPKTGDLEQYLTDEWLDFLDNVVPNKATRLLLKNVSWQFADNVLILHTMSDFSVEMLAQQGLEKNIKNFIMNEFNEVCDVQITVSKETEELCSEKELMTPEYAEALAQNAGTDGNNRSHKTARNQVVFGRSIKGTPVPMNTIVEEARNVVIQGSLLNCEGRELKSGRFLLMFDIVDATDGLSAKTFFDNKEGYDKALATLSAGLAVKAKGTVQYDKFARELALFADSLCIVDKPERSDDCEEKRVELHAHTKMSALDSVASVKGLIKTAAKWGQPAIAITDHGVVQAFPEAYDVAAAAGIKLIYGMEGYLFHEDIKQSYHIVILAKNPSGLRNLYRIVSLSHLKYLYRKPRIPKKILSEYREGLIFGSACEAGELIRAIVDGADDEQLLAIASFYDYLEIQPTGNNGFLVRTGRVADETGLEDINKKVIELAERLDKPVVATCDVHFINPEDEVYRRILMAGQGFSDADNQPPLYLRTTREMLAEFAYLSPAKAYEVVVTNSRRIADSIAEFKPIPDELYSPQIPGAEEQISSMSYDHAEKVYGNPLPQVVADRLKLELDSIIGHGFAVLYLIAHKLVKKSLDDGYLVGSRGSVGSSFVAHMTGITEVNALPPHYVCPQCKYSEFIDDGTYGSGFDMPDKACPHCGTALAKDGHNIPFAVFLGFHGDKVPDIDLNFSGDYQPVAHKYTEELFGRDNVFRAGTIATIASKTAYGYVKNYFTEKDIIPRNALINHLVDGCSGVKRTTGQHPAGIMVVPRDMDVHYFTPIQYPADDKDCGTITTHFDYHSISSRLVKLDILGHDDPTVLRMLQDITGIDPRTLPFDDAETMSIFSSTDAIGLTPEQLGNTVGTLGIPEFGTKFVRQMLEDTAPQKFSELVRISGFSHGTDVWLNNAQDLINNGTAKLSEAISARDDIMIYLIQRGVEPASAFKIMEKVRKGKGLNDDDMAKMKAKDVPDWYIGSCQKIKYMFPKAHAVAYVMMAFRIAYFKVHDPKAFYASYFTVRADEFDAELIVQGEAVLREKVREYSAKGNGLTAKEKSIFTILEVALEMYMRGFTFHHVDLYKSDAIKFKIVDDGLLPPLAGLAGLGDNAARNIATARKNKPFSSCEDLRVRAHVPKSVIEILKNHGCLGDMQETDQMVLFA